MFGPLCPWPDFARLGLWAPPVPAGWRERRRLARLGAAPKLQTGKHQNCRQETDWEIFQMKVVSVINYKGGVGKTSLTANLGAELAWRGKRVLLLDLDAQASSHLLIH